MQGKEDNAAVRESGPSQMQVPGLVDYYVLFEKWKYGQGRQKGRRLGVLSFFKQTLGIWQSRPQKLQGL
nr:hypothetical protein [uncultured Oscillibacter sp.]